MFVWMPWPQEQMDHHFSLLMTKLDKFDFYGHREAIYNMDEMCLPLESRPPKVIAKNWQKKVRYRTSGTKRWNNSCWMWQCNWPDIAAFLIFAAKQINPQWCADELSGIALVMLWLTMGGSIKSFLSFGKMSTFFLTLHLLVFSSFYWMVTVLILKQLLLSMQRKNV